MSQPPTTYQDFKKAFPALMESYERLGDAVQKSGPLNEKERAIAKLAIAVGAGLEGGVHSHTRRGLDAALTPEEIRHVVILSLTTIGFPSMMKTFTWVEDVLESIGKK